MCIFIVIYMCVYNINCIIALTDNADDTGALMYLNQGTLLNNLRKRYKRDVIYVGLIINIPCA